MNDRAAKIEAFGRLLDIMDTLRAECPWDKKQTLESLRRDERAVIPRAVEALAPCDRIGERGCPG